MTVHVYKYAHLGTFYQSSTFFQLFVNFYVLDLHWKILKCESWEHEIVIQNIFCVRLAKKDKWRESHIEFWQLLQVNYRYRKQNRPLLLGIVGIVWVISLCPSRVSFDLQLYDFASSYGYTHQQDARRILEYSPPQKSHVLSKTRTRNLCFTTHYHINYPNIHQPARTCDLWRTLDRLIGNIYVETWMLSQWFSFHIWNMGRK